MPITTVSSKFHIVIPKEVRTKLGLSPGKRLQVLEKWGVLILIPERPLKALKGFLKGMSRRGIREKNDVTNPKAVRALKQGLKEAKAGKFLRFEDVFGEPH